MSALAIDLGGTKLSLAVFTPEGEVIAKQTKNLDGRKGSEVGKLITDSITQITTQHPVKSVGVAVPGISRAEKGTVWAPNIEGWEDYPLLEEIRINSKRKKVKIDSDRACCILGETWKGNAKDCKDAIFLAVGTGIGAGIMVDGKIIRGANDIAGAIGWMALDQPYQSKYKQCGSFEYNASGEGLTRVAKEFSGDKFESAYDIFEAYEADDADAKRVIDHAIVYWGMAIANLVSLFNPQKIILGGGVFGPAVKFISAIREEATKWAQPISMQLVQIESSRLGPDAGLYGAAYLALQNSTFH
ncbi:MAG TPA: ROK family protein [Chitinophagaceae bacterium]|nr:ROK family protein [Chitinophagaceae bacterium]